MFLSQSSLRRTVCAVAMTVCMFTLNSTITFGRETNATANIQSADSDDSDRIDIVIKGGYLYVTVQKSTTFRLYSILGQLVMNHNLPSGTSRIKAPARGVYIMQAAGVTRRLTVN